MDKFDLIKRNTEEIVKEEELRTLLEENDSPRAYIGYAPTGFMHTGHMIPVFKIADFLKAGFDFTFLVANLHAYLDDEKTPWELLDARAECYKRCVQGLVDAFGMDETRIDFKKGTDFELDDDYTLNVLRMLGDVTLNRARRAASEVVRFNDDPRLGGFVYPLLQIEDVKALGVDVALGGIDQRGIYMLGREMMDKTDRDKYVCVFTPLVPGLTGSKMSASDASSKIGLLDDREEVERKVTKAHCPECSLEDNGIMAFMKHLVMPLCADRDDAFVVERPDKYGGDVVYTSYDELESDYLQAELHPQDLKNALAAVINDLLDPVRERFEGAGALLERAYPEGM
jgi:tyrosyl-tRNA synthetase